MAAFTGEHEPHRDGPALIARPRPFAVLVPELGALSVDRLEIQREHPRVHGAQPVAHPVGTPQPPRERRGRHPHPGPGTERIVVLGHVRRRAHLINLRTAAVPHRLQQPGLLHHPGFADVPTVEPVDDDGHVRKVQQPADPGGPHERRRSLGAHPARALGVLGVPDLKHRRLHGSRWRCPLSANPAPGCAGRRCSGRRARVGG